MALNKELIQKQEPLKDLSDDQIEAIVGLSTNDENTVIGARIGEIYGDLDKDIKESFGVDKNQGEKTYDYLKRVGGELKTNLETKASELQNLSQEKTELEKKITDGKGDEAVVTKLRDTEQRFNDLQSKYETDKTEWQKTKEELEKDASNIKVDYEFDKATSNLTFKPEIDDIKDVMILSAKQKILNQYKAEEVDDKGTKIFIFRDSEGKVVNNPDKGLAPATTVDLMAKELKKVLAEKSGTGTKPPKGTKGVSLIDVSNAGTQVEADEIIVKHLLSTGLTKDKPEFAHKQKEIRTELKVSEKPIS